MSRRAKAFGLKYNPSTINTYTNEREMEVNDEVRTAEAFFTNKTYNDTDAMLADERTYNKLTFHKSKTFGKSKSGVLGTSQNTNKRFRRTIICNESCEFYVRYVYHKKTHSILVKKCANHVRRTCEIFRHGYDFGKTRTAV